MKKLYSTICLWCFIAITLCACGKQELANMTTEVNDDYSAIIWKDKTYVPYCAFSKADCGDQIGIIDNDKNDKVYEYKGYTADAWIINMYGKNSDTVMLYREISVSDIPDGLQSEYEWNHENTVAAQEEADTMQDRIPMVRVNGKLYYDTGRESTVNGRCGNMDGEITTSVDETDIPMEDYQSNFGSGFGYQYGADDTIEIYMNEKWFVFECREASVIKTYDVSEPVEEGVESDDFVVMVKHYEMSDGTWKTDDYTYQYRLEITGRMGSASKDSTFVFLSNIKDITFERAWKAAGFSSNMNDYFNAEDAKFVAMK